MLAGLRQPALYEQIKDAIATQRSIALSDQLYQEGSRSSAPPHTLLLEKGEPKRTKQISPERDAGAWRSTGERALFITCMFGDALLSSRLARVCYVCALFSYVSVVCEA